MSGVLSCEVLRYNVWGVLAAAIACLVGCWVQISLFQRGAQARGLQRAAWQFLGANASGLSIWCTHFLAILAFRPGAPVGFDATLTIASALVAVAGAALSFGLAMQRAASAAAVGGAALGLSITTMHYFGMMAYRVEGLVTWNPPLVALSALVACGFGAAALHVAAHGRRPWRRAAAVVLLMAAVLGLHFLGVAAFRIAPLTLSVAETNDGSFAALGLAVLGVTSLVAGAAVVSYLLDSDLRAESSSHLREMAMHDALTGLPNRAALRVKLARALETTKRQDGAAALVVIDLRDFKDVNDQYGEATGDDLLKLLALRLRALAHEREFVARIGGDKFAVVQAPSDRAALDDLVNRLLRRLADRAQLGAFSGPFGAHVGVAMFPGDAGDLEALVNHAELALARAKAEHASAPCYYERGMDERARARRKRATELRAAVAQGGLALHYQKQVSVNDGALRGFEALARWPLPEGGFVAPTEFIPLAEECGLIDELGEWVLRTAAREAANWRPPAKVAVNLSPLQLARPDLSERVAQILEESGLPPERLELELTESALMRDPEQALATMRAIRAVGVTIALDDFGTGHSSLAILRKFPFDKIKLDRSFLWEIEGDIRAMAILRAVLALGRSLGVAVLAEGIETEAHLQMLREEACSLAQGYYLGRPAPLAKLIADGDLAVGPTPREAAA
jgi:diguanylate cyclase (GGDEF)-like protein